MKSQLNVFFLVSITAMSLKLVAGVLEDWISFENEDDELVSETTFNYIFILGVMNLFSDLSFSGLILSYLMSSAEREREIRESILIEN